MFTFVVVCYTMYLLLLKRQGSWGCIRRGLLNRYSLSVNGGFLLCAGALHLADWKFVDTLPQWIRPLANKELLFVCCVVACFAICGTYGWFKDRIQKAEDVDLFPAIESLDCYH
jgi:hypothetical protein